MSYAFYYKYSDYLKNKYGEKVYKLPVSLPVSCPNRSGGSGCTFCADVGTGFESLSPEYTVEAQLRRNMDYIRERYHAKKFIAYFQNYTNTYMPLEDFKGYIRSAVMPDIAEVSISTRPDCIREDYLDFLESFYESTGIAVNIELGLQTVNYHTLDSVNRGHGLAEFIDSVLRIKHRPFTVCTHLILNLPGDTLRDSIETSKFVSVLPIDIVKLHSLYIPKNSVMAAQYKNHAFDICSKEAYLLRVKTFIEYLNPDIAIERLFSRIPEEDALFSNWQTSWWKLNGELEAMMAADLSRQGLKFHYTNGSKL